MGNFQGEFTPCRGGDDSFGGIENFYAIANDNGDRVGVGCRDFFFELWNLVDGTRLSRFKVAKDKYAKGIFPYIHGDGRRVLFKFTGIGEYAELWDAVNGKKIATLTSEATKCRCNRTVYVANGISPDGKTVAVSFAGKTFLFEAETGKLLRRLVDDELVPETGYETTHVGIVTTLLFSRNSETLYTLSSDGIKIWEVQTGKLIRRFRDGPLKGIYALAVSPDEEIIAMGGETERVTVWSTKTGRLLWKSPDLGKEIGILNFSPDSQKILVLTATRATLWDVKNGTLLGQFPLAARERFPAISPDWHHITLYDPKTKKIGLYEFLN
ncbi:MAG: WD40 repeat domain-containing protein [Pyrinomonadaceae bacterium]